jgi:cytochrome P450
MALLISLLTFAVPLTLVYYLYKHLNNQRLARQYGCRAPKAYPHLDPVFGLDLFGKTLLAVRRHSHIEETHARFARHGSTYRAVSLGMNVFNTIDPINIRTIYSTESLTVWGAEPMRLPAMEPMCGRGFITTDGDSWQKARSMLKPSFNKARVEDLAVFGGMIDTFIANLPKDGATVDMIPQLYNLFLDSAGVFLVGSGFGAVSKDQSKSTDDAPVDPQSFLDAFHSAEIWMGIRMIFGALGRLAPTGRWMKQVRMVHDFVDHTVDQAMDKGSVDEQARHTLLKSLASQTSDRHEIRYQIIQALMATQDTTSTLLSNALFCLSRDPTMWARLREEALAMSSPPTPAELKKSRLIANIMNEGESRVSCPLSTTNPSPSLPPLPPFSLAPPHRKTEHDPALRWRPQRERSHLRP